MIAEEIMPCPFERAIVGPHGAVLLRSNHEHAERVVTAIRRRAHPEWSRYVCGFRTSKDDLPDTRKGWR